MKVVQYVTYIMSFMFIAGKTADLKAYTRGVTFRTDHPHEDLNSVILKGIIWGTCLICFTVVMRSSERQTT